MPRTAFAELTVLEAARVLGCAPQTVRRLLQQGRLPGRKHGQVWIVWWWVDTDDAPRGRPSAPCTTPATTPAALRQWLWRLGAMLIAVGNQTAGTHPRRHTHEAKHWPPLQLQKIQGGDANSCAVFARWYVFFVPLSLLDVRYWHKPVGEHGAGQALPER
jgi:excisionase family DNA binding protein